MEYSVHLMDKKTFPEEQRRIIEQRYSRALAHQLGGPELVASAHRDWVKAKTHQDEASSCASEISLREKQAIVHWEYAETAARLLALEGYTGALDDIYILVKTEAVTSQG
jgi:hypothetical protein